MTFQEWMETSEANVHIGWTYFEHLLDSAYSAGYSEGYKDCYESQQEEWKGDVSR